MKLKLIIPLLLAFANSSFAADLTFSTSPQDTDSANTLLQRQAVSLWNMQSGYSSTLSAWNSGTSLNATQNIHTNNGGAGSVLVNLIQTTTLTAGAITFEVSYDGTNWVTVPADAVVDPSSTSLAQISLPYTVQASTNKPFLIINRGWQALRIKLSTQITGTGSVTPNYSLLSFVPYVHTDQDYIKGAAISTAGPGVQDVNPKRVAGSTVLAPNYYHVLKTDKTTTTMTSSTCYITQIAYNCSGAGTSWTLQFKDKGGTAAIITAAITLTANAAGPTSILNLAEPIIATGGLDIITGGTTAGTVDIWVTYWQ